MAGTPKRIIGENVNFHIRVNKPMESEETRYIHGHRGGKMAKSDMTINPMLTLPTLNSKNSIDPKNGSN